MKKVLALFISLLFLFLFGSSVFAADASLSWEETGPTLEDVFGDTAHFVRLNEVDAKIWLPDYLAPVELTPEDLENNAVSCYLSEDETEMLYITYVDVNNLSLEAFQRQLAQNDITSQIIDVNGIPALIYMLPEDNVTMVTYSTVDGYFLQLMHYPYYDDFFTMILSSLQPDVIEEDAVPVEPVNPVSGLIHK